jgi:hypothetical protein
MSSILFILFIPKQNSQKKKKEKILTGQKISNTNLV